MVLHAVGKEWFAKDSHRLWSRPLGDEAVLVLGRPEPGVGRGRGRPRTKTARTSNFGWPINRSPISLASYDVGNKMSIAI